MIQTETVSNLNRYTPSSCIVEVICRLISQGVKIVNSRTICLADSVRCVLETHFKILNLMMQKLHISALTFTLVPPLISCTPFVFFFHV